MKFESSRSNMRYSDAGYCFGKLEFDLKPSISIEDGMSGKEVQAQSVGYPKKSVKK